MMGGLGSGRQSGASKTATYLGLPGVVKREQVEAGGRCGEDDGRVWALCKG